eukprot:TRINITY_DN17373_c0_g1_i1.p1 TRINITY_DN17373_c0_g1~~TRINITY_DN17373_c0_g1_i1.p1  ORF type:complete len:502 (-),score=81.35 TRINITY_DN17373_c0_g1_i1:458-1963(-)
MGLTLGGSFNEERRAAKNPFKLPSGNLLGTYLLSGGSAVVRSVLTYLVLGLFCAFLLYSVKNVSSAATFVDASSLVGGALRSARDLSLSAQGVFFPSKTLPPPPLEGCGTWQEDYIALHASILSGALPPRYAVSIGVEAGLADRLVGVISEFYYALLSRRALLITPGNQPDFALAWDAPYIKWRADNFPEELVNHMNNRVHDQHVGEGAGLYIPEGFQYDKAKYGYIYMTNTDASIFRTHNFSETPDGGQQETVFLASNRGRTYVLFENPNHGEQLRAWGLTPETAFACAFNFLFRPNQAVVHHVEKEMQRLSKPNTLLIGVNVRVGDRVFSDDSGTPLSEATAYLECAKQVEETRRAEGQEVVWYFISDSLTLRKKVNEEIGEKLLVNIEQKTIHPNCAFYGPGACEDEAKAKGKGGEDVSLALTPAAAGLIGAAAQLLAFSQTRYQVITQQSGFGRIGAWLSIFKHRESLQIYEIGNPIPCGPQDAINPLHSSLTYSGI